MQWSFSDICWETFIKESQKTLCREGCIGKTVVPLYRAIIHKCSLDPFTPNDESAVSSALNQPVLHNFCFSESAAFPNPPWSDDTRESSEKLLVSHVCDKIPWWKQLKGERVYFDSQFKGTDLHGEGTKGLGTWNIRHSQSETELWMYASAQFPLFTQSKIPAEGVVPPTVDLAFRLNIITQCPTGMHRHPFPMCF